MKRRLLGFLTVLVGVAPAASASGAWNLAVRPVSVHLGLRLIETTPQLRKNLGVDADRGALVVEVEPGGPGDRAGLQAGDVVTRIAKKHVGDAGDALEAVANRRPGDTVRVDFVRATTHETTRVMLARARDPGFRIGGWTLPFPGGHTPKEMEDELHRFRDQVERHFRDLERRLRRPHEESPERTST